MKIVDISQFLAAQLAQRPFQSPAELGLIAAGLLAGLVRDWMSAFAWRPMPAARLVPVASRRRVPLANGLRGYVDPFARARDQW